MDNARLNIFLIDQQGLSKIKKYPEMKLGKNNIPISICNCTSIVKDDKIMVLGGYCNYKKNSIINTYSILFYDPLDERLCCAED